MPDSPPPETLAWLRQCAKVEGVVAAQVMLHLLDRVEALEQRPTPGTVELAAPTPEAAPVATDVELKELCWGIAGESYGFSHTAIRACYNLGRQHGAAQPPAAPPAGSLVAKALAKTTAILNDPGRALLTEVRKTLELNLRALEQFSAPAPPAAPAGGLVERVVNVLGHYGDRTARDAIREVAAWMRENHAGYNAARWLEQEADR
jgi:hypothetical protein